MSKPIVLLLSDVHTKPENVKVVEDVFDQAIEICLKKKIKFIFFAGDMFQSRAHQPLEVLTVVKRILLKIKKAGIIIYSIHGNHDQKDQNSSTSYLSLYSNLLKHFSKTGIVKIGNLTFHFLSYFKDNDLYLSYLKKLRKEGIDDKTILITHKGFNGVKNNDGSVVSDEIGPKEVKKYYAVLVGHYHDPSNVGENIIYFGAALQHTFGENTEKGFTIINSNGSFSFVNSKFPKFITHKFLLDEFSKEDCREFVKNNPNEKDNVRVVFVGEEYDINKIDKEGLEAAGIDVKFEKGNKIIKDDIEEPEAYLPIRHDKKSILKAFLNYSKENDFTVEQRSSMFKIIQLG